ncbi:MAG: hypothetical protein OEZ38_11140 [Gammaproteobacteria bacterium]|nr:hypothetical protein [Gammaproteobacteria bacterium]
MPFPTVDNDMLNTGLSNGQIPVIGAGNKLPDSIINGGVGANQFIKLDGSARLPAVDASLLTNLPTPSGGAGGMNLLDEQIIVSPVGQIDFTTGIDGSYDFYKIIATDIRADVSFSPAIRFYLGGALITSNNYHTPRTKLGNTDANNTYYSNNDSNLSSSVISPTTFNSTPGSPFNNIIIEIPNPAAVNAHKMTRNHCYMVSDAGALNFVESATVCTANTNALTGIRFFPLSGGNFTRGTFKLYGIN